MPVSSDLAKYRPLTATESVSSKMYKFKLELPECVLEVECPSGNLGEDIDFVMGTQFLSQFNFQYNYPKEGEFIIELLPSYQSSNQ